MSPLDDDLGDELLDADAHSHVLDALRTLLADGRSATPDDLCARGIAQGLLPPGTLPKYVVNAIRGAIGRQRLRNERPDFIFDDGWVHLNQPRDPFAGYAPPATDPPFDLDALTNRLAETSRQIGTPSGETNVGAPFERAVAESFARLGLVVRHDGRQGQPDVIAVAALGDTAYTVVIECKSANGDIVPAHDSAIPEIAKFRDAFTAQYAVLIGPGFPDEATIDTELQTHRIALWTAADLAAVLRAAAHHPIPWSGLIPLFAPGRSAGTIASFCFRHVHGPYERARVTYRYMLEEGLAYQELLLADDPDIEHRDSPLTVDVLATLVNQRLARENDAARVGVSDIDGALILATHELFATATRDPQGRITIQRRFSYRPPSETQGRVA